MQKPTSKKHPMIIAMIGSVLLMGCTSKPREVSASVSLVDKANTPIGESIPPQYWNELENPTSTSLEHDNYLIKLSPLYTSGLGVTCRSLEVQTQSEGKRNRIACAQQTTDINGNDSLVWFLTPNIVEAATAISIQ